MVLGPALLVATSLGAPRAIGFIGVPLTVVGFASYLRIGTVHSEPPRSGCRWTDAGGRSRPRVEGARPWLARVRPDLRDRPPPVPEGKYAPTFG